MSEFSWPFQVAIHGVLLNKTDCNARLYETVPENPQYPYLHFGEIVSKRSDHDCVDQTTEQVTLTIICKGSKAKSEALKIAAEISNILRNQQVLIDGLDDCFVDVIAEYGRKDVEYNYYNQFLRIEAHISKQKEL